MLTVYVDFKTPGAYLALAPTLELVDRLALEVTWKPFQTVERDVPQLGKQETVGESHRRVRAASQRALAVKYAGHQGIDLIFPDRSGSTDLALGVLAEIDGDSLAFIRAAFEAYWQAHADLDDPAIVQELIKQSEASHSGDLSNARATLEASQSDAEEIGIVGAPAYLIKEQIFVGREHLPWIEELAIKECQEV